MSGITVGGTCITNGGVTSCTGAASSNASARSASVTLRSSTTAGATLSFRLDGIINAGEKRGASAWSVDILFFNYFIHIFY